jgi:hypothetical protein
MAIEFATGQRLTADLLNTNLVPPDEAFDAETADEAAWTNTSFDSGTNVCGTTFIAPESGNVLVLWSARFQSNTNNVRAAVSVSVATGSSIGSGSVVSAASDDSAIETTQSSAATATPAETRIQTSMFRRVTGLTAGDTYNVVVQKKVLTAGNGTVFQRDVVVIPLF